VNARLAALADITWDLIVWGHRGGPATRRHPTYAWLCSIPAGRLALLSVRFGLECIAAGTLALLAIRLRRGEYAAVTS
jgi:hypothetical protein